MKQKKCIKCGHEWLPRINDPKQCPRCKNYDWKIKIKDIK